MNSIVKTLHMNVNTYLLVDTETIRDFSNKKKKKDFISKKLTFSLVGELE